MDIQKEIGYTINGTEIGFFGIILQQESAGIVPTYISMGAFEPDVKEKIADSLIQFGQNIKEDMNTMRVSNG